MKRRSFIAAAAIAFSLIVVKPAVAEDITLEFTVWNYSLDTIQDNARKFEAENPGIKVKITDYTWQDYHDSLVLRFRGGTPTDIAYVGQDWLPAWAAAGFLAPLDDVATADVLGDLKKDIAGFSVSDMTYKDKLYGLPYYADTISFIYNKKVLADAGIAVPQTWDEVMAAAEKLKAGGMEHPIAYEFDQELPNFFDAFVSQVYGRGGELFDKDLKAVFDNPDNAAYKQLDWLVQAFKKDLVQQETHESKIIPSMNTGKHAFTIVFNYVLAAMNNAAEQPLAGQFALAPMPGESHAALGFTKFYSITAQAAKDPARAEAAWKFVNFMAGKPYTVAKRWAVEKGLGFGQVPLFDDPEVQAAWNKWIDSATLKNQVATARGGVWTEWTSVWTAYFRPLLAKAMVGEATVDETMKAGAQRWNELRDKMMK
ncbi:MAG TPA: sugar ABC transporter substrate-binding protein [Aestuariivirgaceae bacterium]|nr:sugar ABC transporter substrate-binding protein [Aestuariivirgaceae bacterium]